MYKVKNKITGRIGIFNPSEDNGGGVIVYALPNNDYSVIGPKIAEYKTRKNFWQRWGLQR